MEAFLASFSIVAIAEMGDKTQLLSFVLATRFKNRQWAIIAGVFVATLANHFVAAYLGDWVASHISPNIMRWLLGLSFLGFAGWALIPDKLDGEPVVSRHGAFLTTLIAFFVAEMGDKTQFATIALGARFDSLSMVVIGTTLGMMAANIPAILLGERLARYVPIAKMRFVAAVLFAAFGLAVLGGLDSGFSGG